ncbi:protein of unknown function [Burkholderia multivorans]
MRAAPASHLAAPAQSTVIIAWRGLQTAFRGGIGWRHGAMDWGAVGGIVGRRRRAVGGISGPRRRAVGKRAGPASREAGSVGRGHHVISLEAILHPGAGTLAVHGTACAGEQARCDALSAIRPPC